jgi:hypothetical protein
MEPDTRKMIELWAARSDNIKNAIKAVEAAARNSAQPLCELPDEALQSLGVAQEEVVQLILRKA